MKGPSRRPDAVTGKGWGLGGVVMGLEGWRREIRHAMVGKTPEPVTTPSGGVLKSPGIGCLVSVHPLPHAGSYGVNRGPVTR